MGAGNDQVAPVSGPVYEVSVFGDQFRLSRWNRHDPDLADTLVARAGSNKTSVGRRPIERRVLGAPYIADFTICHRNPANLAGTVRLARLFHAVEKVSIIPRPIRRPACPGVTAGVLAQDRNDMCQFAITRS